MVLRRYQCADSPIGNLIIKIGLVTAGVVLLTKAIVVEGDGASCGSLA